MAALRSLDDDLVNRSSGSAGDTLHKGAWLGRQEIDNITNSRYRILMTRALCPIILSIMVIVLNACGGESSSSSLDNRTRRNEWHITIHQDADSGSPIIGWAIENGNPSKGDVRTNVWFLELTVLGNADHPTNCAVSMEHAVTNQLDEDPILDDPSTIGDDNPKTERSYTVTCSEKPDSTRISWPGGAIAMTGHVTENTSDDSGEQAPSNEPRWSFAIDHIQRAPRTTKFDPEDSFTWPSPQASMPR